MLNLKYSGHDNEKQIQVIIIYCSSSSFCKNNLYDPNNLPWYYKHWI